MTTPVLMQTQNDCEIAAIATATGKAYEETAAAFTPLPAIDPIRGNPEALYLALVRLALWKKNITWSMLETHQATPGKTVILIHNPETPTLLQHWIVLAGYSPDGFSCYWGYPLIAGRDAALPVFVDTAKMKDLFLRGWPNCAFEISPDTLWMRIKRRLGFL
ncbi:MAG: hypothetical protein HQM09_15275 [Candidatus Riflebacteria bacterium]|nr:hypothetical protein [Candidatus Riflebacteria bacterium]